MTTQLDTIKFIKLLHVFPFSRKTSKSLTSLTGYLKLCLCVNLDLLQDNILSETLTGKCLTHVEQHKK